MKAFLIALTGSILTVIYWWIVTTVSFGLFSGDRNPRLPPPSETAIEIQTWVTMVVAIVLYALLSMVWSRIVRRRP